MAALSKRNLIEELDSRLAKLQLSWSYLDNITKHIVIIGSWAAGMNEDSSDMDVVAVVERKIPKIKTLELELIFEEEKLFIDSAYNHRDLATHTGKYGIWLKGDELIRKHPQVTDESIWRKRKYITERLDALEKAKSLPTQLAAIHYKRVQLDIHRLIHFKQYEPTPCRPILEQEIASSINSPNYYNNALKNDLNLHLRWKDATAGL